MEYKDKYIGQKQITKITEEQVLEDTPAIFSVEFADGTKELLSSLMLDKIVSEESCDLSELRDKRVKPIVEEVLEVFKNWGLKFSEIPYFSVLFSQSLEYNQNQAIIELWKKYTGRTNMLAPDDIDFLTVDKILKEIKKEDKITIQDVISGK